MACQRCRRLKTGCDRASPQCARCERARVRCEYFLSPDQPGPPDTQKGSKSANATKLLSSAEESLFRGGYDEPSPDDPDFSAALWLDELRKHLDHSSDAVQKLPQPKRDRAILSCARCRKHKVRCDRRSPCGRCVNVNKQANCTYPGSNSSTQRANPPENSQTLSTIALNYPRPIGDLRFRSRGHWSTIFHKVNYLSLDCKQ